MTVIYFPSFWVCLTYLCWAQYFGQIAIRCWPCSILAARSNSVRSANAKETWSFSHCESNQNNKRPMLREFMFGGSNPSSHFILKSHEMQQHHLEVFKWYWQKGFTISACIWEVSSDNSSNYLSITSQGCYTTLLLKFYCFYILDCFTVTTHCIIP